MKKQWKRLAALSSAAVMAAGTLLYFPTDTLQNISWDHGECVGNRCRDRIRIADMDRRQPDLDTHRRRHNDHQRHRGDEGL